MRVIAIAIVGVIAWIATVLFHEAPAHAPTLRTTTTTLPADSNPFLSSAMHSYLKGRTGLVTAAVYDVASGQTYLYNPGVREVTASMVKIDILAALLHESQLQHRVLTADESQLATTMVESSSNRAATKLWNDVGQMPPMSAFNQLIGFKQTIMSWSWGEIQTTPLDQLALLKVIELPNSILTASSRAYEASLMQNVDTFERFGLGTGPPPTATIGLKDGYYPEPITGWQINSAGYVHLGSRFYLGVIMTSHNPNEGYGIDTVNEVAKLIWENLKP